MITLRINDNEARARQTAARLGGTGDCEVNRRRPGEIICRLPCKAECRRRAQRAFAAGSDGVVWINDTCPSELRGPRRRRRRR